MAIAEDSHTATTLCSLSNGSSTLTTSSVSYGTTDNSIYYTYPNTYWVTITDYYSSPPNFLMCCTLNNVVQKARDLLLPEEEKILKKAGFKNDEGQWSDSALRIFMERQMNEPRNFDDLVELAEELNEENEKKNKKCSGC